jgi:hypothetical protein
MSDENQTESKGPPAYVSSLNSIEEQIGKHILECLRTDGTVAVISTVMSGIGSSADRIVSMPVTPEQMGQIDLIINGGDEDNETEQRCIGFQCDIPPVKAE